jgi:hypothetical protein
MRKIKGETALETGLIPEIPLKPENIILEEKILSGMRKAQRKLLEERAANNDTVVISVNGVASNVPARELLKSKPR